MKVSLSILCSVFVVGSAITPTYAADGDTRIVNGLEGPAMPSGFTSELLGMVPLDDQIDGMTGWNLRTRRVTFEPGGVAPVHPHTHRPAVFYILKGNLVEHRSDLAEEQFHKAGDTVKTTHGVAHWWENINGEPAIVLATDIVSDAELTMGRSE